MPAPWILPLQGHPAGGAEGAAGEVQVEGAQGVAHLYEGPRPRLGGDLCPGKYARRQVLAIHTSRGFNLHEQITPFFPESFIG